MGWANVNSLFRKLNVTSLGRKRWMITVIEVLLGKKNITFYRLKSTLISFSSFRCIWINEKQKNNENIPSIQYIDTLVAGKLNVQIVVLHDVLIYGHLIFSPSIFHIPVPTVFKFESIDLLLLYHVHPEQQESVFCFLYFN